MATTSPVRGNLLLLSSKRSQSFHTNPCSIKSIEFRGPISSFRLNKVRVKCFIIKSNLSSASNNNVATPFKFEAPFRCSSSKENAFGKSVISTTLRVLQWLKVPATVMAWSLLLGMIMYRRKSAFALSGGSMGGDSFSSSCSSSPDYSSNEDGSKGSEKTNATAAYGVLLILIFSFIMAVTVSTTVFKIQVGLLVSGEGLKRNLNQIAKSTNTSNSSDWDYILKETINSLRQYRKNWISSYSSVNCFCRSEDVQKWFNNLSNEERKIFDEETLINLNNIKKENITGTEEANNQNENTYMVVTILVALEGKHQLPAISDGEDLHNALEKLKSNRSKIQAVNVLWGPQKANEILSHEVLQKKFPLLKSFTY